MTDPTLDTTFPAVPLDDWLAQAPGKNKEPFTEMPVTNLEDDLQVPWLFTPADALAPDPAGAPDTAPFVRVTHPHGAWDIRQEHGVADRREANTVILEDLEGGATALTLRLDDAARDALAPDDGDFADARGRGGTAISSVDDLEVVLDGVYADLAAVALDAGAQGLPAAALLLAFWRRREYDLDAIRGALRLDPLGALAQDGELPLAPQDALKQAAAVAAEADTLLPAVSSLAVDTRAYVAAGASPVQELAIAAATGVAYLRAADDAGLPADKAAARIEVTLQVGADQFAEMAKLRAWRRIWARVLEAGDVPAEARRSPLYARTSRRVMADVDPWVNMLRATTATFAAATGGADGISVEPFDSVRADRTEASPDYIGRRMARNTQLILQEESGIAKVADPAGGSWYVEWLTDQLARAAWSALQDIERRGGILGALADGGIAGAIAASTAERDQKTAVRARELTGVNTFPLLGDDKVAPTDAVDRVAIGRTDVDRAKERAPHPVTDLPPAGEGLLDALARHAADGARIDELAKGLSTGAPYRALPFPVQRESRAFERLRRAADAHVASGGTAPTILLACIGPIAQHVNVATWTRAFFETAGIRAITSEPLDDAAGAKAALAEHPATLAVVCSGAKDEDAEARVADVITGLRDGGATTVYLAGAKDDAARAAGADEGVRRGVDLLDVLSRALTRCGVDLEAIA